MDYLTALSLIHDIVNPLRYAEIGCQFGHSLALAKCPSVVVDPSFELRVPCAAPVRLFRMTSDDFFSQPDVEEVIGGPLDLSFIDGMHLAEYALRDFMSLERLSGPHGVIVIDDVLPPHMEAASRERHTKKWTGDVYRVVPILREYRPDLCVQVYDVEEKGMCVISRLSLSSTTLFDNLSYIEQRLLVGDWESASLDDIWANSKVRSVDHFVEDIGEIAARGTALTAATQQKDFAIQVENLLRAGGIPFEYRSLVRQRLVGMNDLPVVGTGRATGE